MARIRSSNGVARKSRSGTGWFINAIGEYGPLIYRQNEIRLEPRDDANKSGLKVDSPQIFNEIIMPEAMTMIDDTMIFQ